MSTLKDRLVAYEQGASSSSTSAKARPSNPPSDAPALSLKEKMLAYQQGVASSATEEATQDASQPTITKESRGWSTLKARMKTYEYQQLRENSLQQDATREDNVPKPRPKMSSALQERLAKLQEASSASSSKKKVEEELKLAAMRGGLARYKERFEGLSSTKQDEEGNRSYQSRKAGGSSLIQQRMAMLSEMNKEQTLDGASREGRGRDMREFHQRMMAFREAIASKKQTDEVTDTTTRRASAQGGSDFQQRLSKFAEASSTRTFQPPAFADASATDAFKKGKSLFGETRAPSPQEDSRDVRADSSRFIGTAGSDLQNRMKRYEDASAPVGAVENTSREHSNSLKERVLKLEETLSTEEHIASRAEINIAGSSLQERMMKFEDLEAVQNDSHSLEGKNVTAAGDLQEETVMTEGGDAISNQSEVDQEKLEGGGSGGAENSAEVDNEAASTQEDATEEDAYLYDLAVNYNLLQLKQQNTPCKSSTSIDEEKGDGRLEKASNDVSVEGEAGVHISDDKAPADRLDSPSTTNTPVKDENASKGRALAVEDSAEGAQPNEACEVENTEWLNEDWIKQHLVRDTQYNSLEFRLRDRTLFEGFDALSDERKCNLISTFVKLLLLHANGATQLDLSGSLLPDEFFLALAEEILKDPAGTFPKLQLLHLELGGLGIEAISEVVAHKSTWKYLQILLIENDNITSEAEKALSHAVGQNTSPIVVCSATIRDPTHRIEIEHALEYNQFLLFCATGSLFGVEVDSLDVFTKVGAEVDDTTKEP